MSYKIIHPTRCYPTIITSQVTCIRQKKKNILNHYYHFEEFINIVP